MLGREIESRAGEVAQGVLERWLKQHPEPGGSVHTQVHRDILRITELATISLGHFLVSGQFPTAKERDALASPGKAPVRETIALDDLTKLYFWWRDVACETLEGLAGQLGVRDRQSMTDHVGSNMWAVRPDKSASGKALMFINPHQPFFGPGQWYEGHVTSDEGWNLLGACFFGSPFPTLGYNGHVAWSHTVNNPDIVDLYTVTFEDKTDPLKYRYGVGSRQATAWTEDVVVKDAKGPVSRRFRFTKTHQGPLVAVRNGKPLAIRLAKLEEGGAIEQACAMGRAKSVADFKEAMRPCNLPMFNAIVADTGGNIFYVYNGAVPTRSGKFDWTKPVDG